MIDRCGSVTPALPHAVGPLSAPTRTLTTPAGPQVASAERQVLAADARSDDAAPTRRHVPAERG